ncbi:MAG: phage shock protein operon transcriptional activator [Pseudomonadota bacterium]
MDSDSERQRSSSSEDNPLVGESPAFLEMLEQVSSVAPLNRPVLVIGERGTGKELIAARIHFLSRRWDENFVKLNCAALADTVLESELFGHEAGSFTGAQKRRVGRFELADKGTLFLDELANISSAIQEKILRVIEYGEFERLGGNQVISVNTRIVGATNVDLPMLAAKGEFRADLLDRLAFDVITLPALRHRGEDIVPLAEHFARRMAAELQYDLFPGFSADALKDLMDYRWPGNVRELKNVVERAVYRWGPSEEPIDQIQFDPFESPFRPGGNDEPAAGAAPGAELSGPLDLKETVKDFEIGLLRDALEKCQFNQRKAAEYLGLSYDQLRGYLRKYKLLDSN